ncbi:MAG: hypothetical protein J6U53_03930 [Tidjanibacter sp.]|nr:hypothetical protein [Tidjanibacter sp.]
MNREQKPFVRHLFGGVSLLFHPLTMAVWMTLLVMLGVASPLTYSSPLGWYVVGTVAFMTLFVPLLFRWLLRLFGVRRNDADGRHTQLLTMLMMVFCYTTCGWVFEDIVLLYLMRKVLYTFTASVVVAIVFEFFYPLSHHTMMLGSVLGMMWMLLLVGNVALLVPFIIGILLAGVLSSARLSLTDCKVGAVVWGLLVGFAISAIMLVII